MGGVQCDITEAGRLARLAAEALQPGGRGKVQIRSLAMKLGWRMGRMRDIWYGRAHRIDAFEMDRLRELCDSATHKSVRTHTE